MCKDKIIIDKLKEENKTEEIEEMITEYNGFKADIFSLGVTLIEITLGLYCFQKAYSGDKHYKFLLSENRDIASYWNSFGKLSQNLSENFKDLCNKMISPEIKERPTIIKILEHKWFEEIRDMEDEQLKLHEEKIKLKKEFERRLPEVLVKSKKELNSTLEKDGYKIIPKSIDSIKYFDNNISPRFIEIGQFANYYIAIKGYFDPCDFMNYLRYEISDKFGEDCLMENENPYKHLILDLPFKEKIQKEKLEFESEENEETDYKIINMQIELYQTKEGYLLKFNRKEENKKYFYEKFEIISEIVKKIIK